MRALTFIGAEEEQFVFDDWAADRSAKRVTHEVRGSVRQARAVLSLFVEPIIGLPEVRPVVFVEAAVHVIRAALRDQRNLSTRGTSLISVGIARGDTEFFNGVQRGAKSALEGIAVVGIVVVDSIKRYVRLV